jgi:hypothetical protein
MPSGWSDFLTKHWVVGGIAASLLWFVAGRQSLENGKPDIAIFWQAVGVLVALALSGWSIAEREWLGLVCGVGLAYLEVRAIKRITDHEKEHKASEGQ